MKQQCNSQKKCRLFNHFYKNEDGAVILEYALIALPFLLMIFGIMHVGFLYWANLELENATNQASRLILTGQQPNESTFKTFICNNSTILHVQDCQSSLIVDVRQLSGNFQSIGSINFDPTDEDNEDQNSSYDSIPGDTVALVTAYYRWPNLTGFFRGGMSNGDHMLRSTVAMRTEAYTNVAAYQIPTSGTRSQLFRSGEKMVVPTTTTAVREGKLEVVMVLDNTGSMSGSKLEALKTAANSLVNLLYENTDNVNRLKIGLVPFSSSVRVTSGGDGTDIPWIDTAGNSSLHREDIDLPFGTSLFSLYGSGGITNRSWKGCVRARIDGYDITDEPPLSGETLWVPFFAPGVNSNANSYWNGPNGYFSNYRYLGQISQSPQIVQRNPANYSTTIANSNSGPNYLCPNGIIQPLTTDRTTIENAISAMEADGNTVIPTGLAWGWRVISNGSPYTEGVPYDEQDTVKAIILLTDGDNWISQYENGHNRSTFTSYGFATSGHLDDPTLAGRSYHQMLDAKVTQLCNNIKADKDGNENDRDILLYTIAFSVSSQNVINLMTNCASQPNMFYNTTSGTDLDATFQAIARDLNKLRISR